MIGIIVSAPMGPVGVMCIRRTLNKGRWHGFMTGMGASMSDLAYAAVTAFGMSFVFDFINNDDVIHISAVIDRIDVIAYCIIKGRKIPIGQYI